jgi:hypothetical protein
MIRTAKLAAVLMVFTGAVCHASGVIVYPANNQSAEQQNTDEGACLSWASQETGFDPTAPMQTTSAAPQASGSSTSAGQGALRGGLIGLGVGVITGHAGRGAAIGAGTGALVGGTRRRNQMDDDYDRQQDWAEDQAAQYREQQHNFNRAYGVCLQGRGYTVSH